MALAERAEAGVRVRVILDALGAYDLDDEVIHIMEKAGVTVERFRPVRSSGSGRATTAPTARC